MVSGGLHKASDMMLTLNGEKQALWKAWRRKNQSEWQTRWNVVQSASIASG
jgi:hypothetical protein